MTPVGTGRVEARMERKKVERMYPPRLTKILYNINIKLNILRNTYHTITKNVINKKDNDDYNMY